MASEYTIEWKLKDKEVLEKLGEITAQKIKEACVMVQDDAKRECPVDTGRLQGSISYQVEGTEGIVGSNVEYAPYVHDGTSKMAARPFLRNAGEKNKEAILKLFEGALK